jgi:transcription elongation factor/antiterminator RfaH
LPNDPTIPAPSRTSQTTAAPRGASPDAAPDRPGWYVVMMQPRKEAVARTNLERQDYTVFLPMVRRTVRHARQTREVLRPLFPRYGFVALDLARDRWRPILGTFGVSTLIMDGIRPRRVPDPVMDALIEAANPSGKLDYRRQLVVGQEVRFVSGPFAERFGRLLEMDDDDRVQVLLDILGAVRPVAASASDLAPLGS